MTPKTKKQFSEMRERSRKRILEAALELFTEFGFNETTIEKIARKAGISKGLLYNYYDDKEAVLKAVMEKRFSEIEAKFSTLDTIEDPQEKLRVHLEEAVTSIKENAGYWKLQHQLISLPATRPIVQEELNKFLASICKLCEKIFRQMGFLNPLTEVMVFEATFDDMINRYLLSEGTYPIDIVKNHLIEKYCTPRDNHGESRQ